MYRNVVQAAVAIIFLFNIQVQASEYFVTTNGNDSALGTSWETAYLTIGCALANATTAGDIVTVSNGTYGVDSEIFVNRNLTIRSVNGADATILRRSATGTTGTALYRVLQLAHADARVEGFTITNGRLQSSQKGAGVYISAGTLADCNVNSNFAEHHSNGAGIYLDSGGLVIRCRILDNTTSRGNGIGVYFSGGGIVRDSLIAGNHPIVEYDNTFEGKDGAVYLDGGGLLQNCTVVGNDNWLSGGVYCSNDKGSLVNS